MFRERSPIEQGSHSEDQERFTISEENEAMRRILTEKCKDFKRESEDYIDNTSLDLAEVVREKAREIQNLVDDYLANKVNGNIIFKGEDAYDFLAKINNLREIALSGPDDEVGKKIINGLFDLVDFPGLQVERERPQEAFKKILDQFEGGIERN